MTTRTDALAKRALEVWPPLQVDAALIAAANNLEKRKLAERQDITRIKMTPAAKVLFEELRKKVLELDSEILELAEPNSISYHGPAFFLEIIPRRHRLTLLLALDFNEVGDDPLELAKDATEKKFFVHASHEGGVSISIWNSDDIGGALPIIRQAHAVSNE
jgi:predicted transport protein